MAKTDYQSIDEYIGAQPPHAQPVLKRVRATLRKALPKSTEGISYQIPVYKVAGAMVLYFASFRDHYSIYPATTKLVTALRKDLTPHLHGRATLRFSYADAIPTRLITRIAKFRAAEALERQQAKAAKKGSKRAAVKRAKTKPRKRTTK